MSDDGLLWYFYFSQYRKRNKTTIEPSPSRLRYRPRDDRGRDVLGCGVNVGCDGVEVKRERH